LVSAFRRAESYRGDAAVTTWLHRIVVNACLDRARRSRVRAAEPLPEGSDDVVGAAAQRTTDSGSREATDPAQVVVDQERRDLVLRALDSLPVEQRAALVLVDMEGYSVEEAAAVLGCAPGTVKSRCSRGRSRLAPLLAPVRTRPAAEPVNEPVDEPVTGPQPREPGPAPRRRSTRHEEGGEQT
jgi:RNA polymerase sigma-70 factor (ECF subfamily)